MNNINIGIDLGTTNSGIGEYKNGKVTILKNPVGFRETLASVVAFRNERTLVGEKAKELLLSNPENVFSSFKRKMGTSETFHVPEINKSVTPIELSALILKELKNFIINEKLKSAVVTIPASFDTLQSNATKEAGFQGNFKEIVLLQEPIAACLAYSNESNLDINEAKKWLVYDFGGGTFDAAIVTINERSLKVLDHNGNNFLGGIDVDYKILSEIILPKLSNIEALKNIRQKLSDSTDVEYQKFHKYLIYQTEELKKELSIKDKAWLEINYSAFGIYEEIEITRDEIEVIIAPIYKESFQLLDELVKGNDFEYSDFERIIMVGGTTYIPYIRTALSNDTNILIDTSIDPTTAVIIGATYYAGNKETLLNQEKEVQPDKSKAPEKPLITYENSTKDLEELISIQTPEKFTGFYRITRKDGGYDTGMVNFDTKANEFVSLLPKQTNRFTLTLFDDSKKMIFSKDDIIISHGLYNINGQPLPNDICIELDAEEETYLELIFKKNTILPLKKTIYKTFSKSIAKGSDGKVIINIVEGKVGTMPGANLNIGYIEISGKDLSDDLIKGTDIELSFEISESRDVKIEVYIPGADQEIVKTFEPNYQNEISIEKLNYEINNGLKVIHNLLEEHKNSEDYRKLGRFTDLKNELEDLASSILLLKEGLGSDDKYKIADKKRKLLFEIDKIGILEGVANVIEDYKDQKAYLQSKEDSFTPNIKREFDSIVKDEKDFLQSGDKYLIKRKTKALDRLGNIIYLEEDESYYTIFMNLKFLDAGEYRDYKKVEKLFVEGDKAFEQGEIKKLKSICHIIFRYYKGQKKQPTDFGGIGLK